MTECMKCDHYIVHNSATGSVLGHCEHPHKVEMGISLGATKKTKTCKGFTPCVIRIL